VIMSKEIIYKIDSLNIDAVTLQERKRLVEDFSFEIRQGEIIGLVGETGAGKSISMMASVGLLARGLSPVSGEITFKDRKIDAKNQDILRSNLSRGVSLLFQNAKGALNPFMRGKAQIERVLKLNNVPSNQRGEKVRDSLVSVGLDSGEIGPKYAHEISGGQAQRIAIACALATDPKLLIADEPTTALDVTTEKAILNLLKDLCRDRNMALILIAHNLALVAENCDRIYILHAGHVVEIGDVSEVFSNPLHPYTKGLISTIPDVDGYKELIPMNGSVWGGASIINRCRFSHRCPFVSDRCNAGIPPMVKVGTHLVRCILYK
jgi:oligopeptide/dipeptide ABC transporter ATP-binding protein